MKLINQSTVTTKIILPDTTEEQATFLSNESSTEYMTASFSKVKGSNKTFAKPNEEVEQTITLSNNSEYTIEDISIVDTISSGATFKTGSVIIDNTSYPSYDITTGITLPLDIVANDSSVIKYTMIINSPASVDAVTNTAQITYSVNEQEGLIENTNTVSVQVLNNLLTVTKSSDKSAVISGQTLTYSITIKNDGNTTNTDVFFKDPLPSGVTFVTGSVKIDGVTQSSYNPTVGFDLADLDPTEQTIVTFDVTVN